jgi:hypothetical protein
MITKWIKYENDGLITEVSEIYNAELTEINLDITQTEWRDIYVNIILVKLIFINGELVENPDWTEPDDLI